VLANACCEPGIRNVPKLGKQQLDAKKRADWPVQHDEGSGDVAGALNAYVLRQSLLDEVDEFRQIAPHACLFSGPEIDRLHLQGCETQQVVTASKRVDSIHRRRIPGTGELNAATRHGSAYAGGEPTVPNIGVSETRAFRSGACGLFHWSEEISLFGACFGERHPNVWDVLRSENADVSLRAQSLLTETTGNLQSAHEKVFRFSPNVSSRLRTTLNNKNNF
jgi:hypothetical protein